MDPLLPPDKSPPLAPTSSSSANARKPHPPSKSPSALCLTSSSLANARKSRPPSKSPTFALTSSSVASAKKRKLLPNQGSPFSQSVKSEDFTETTKARLEAWHDNKCWGCEATGFTYKCHIMQKGDTGFRIYVDRGLITFDDRKDVTNRICLCGSCHTAFDDFLYPGFTFFPKDLNFFIDFEAKDYDYRRQVVEHGEPDPGRKYPDAEIYKASQVSMREVAPDEVGGIYQRYYLHNYLHPAAIAALQQHNEKSWHGNPTASIMRAFLVYDHIIAGSERIPQEQRDLLKRLPDLYMRPTLATAKELANVPKSRANIVERANQAPTPSPSDTIHGHPPGTGGPDHPNQQDTRNAGAEYGAKYSMKEIRLQEDDSGIGLSESLKESTNRKRARSPEFDDILRRKPRYRKVWVWGPDKGSQQNADLYTSVVLSRKKEQDDD